MLLTQRLCGVGMNHTSKMTRYANFLWKTVDWSFNEHSGNFPCTFVLVHFPNSEIQRFGDLESEILHVPKKWIRKKEVSGLKERFFFLVCSLCPIVNVPKLYLPLFSSRVCTVCYGHGNFVVMLGVLCLML